MNANPGNVIATGTVGPGELSTGQVAAPANVGNIMQNMLADMVTPENINAPHKAPIQLPPTAKESVVIQPPAPPQSPPKAEPDLGLFTEEPQVETAALAPVDDEPDMSDIPDEPKAENWKKAREALKLERKTVRTLTKDFESTKNKLERYEKGEIVPEIITAKDNRIQQLEKYETVFNGKLSEEYQTLVAKPIADKSAALAKLTEDYQVPANIREALIQKIVETENERERNGLITKYFPDAIGASKVENLVKDLHSLGQTALDLEKKPTEIMQSLQAQYQSKKEKEDEVITSQFESIGKVSWSKALEKTAEEGLFPNLIMDPTNSENSKIAESNQHRAAIQYGALLKDLHAGGLKNLKESTGTGMARMIQLAIGSVGIAKELQAAQARIAELEGSGGMMATYLRPGMNTNGHSRPPVKTETGKGPTSPQEAGQAALAVFKK